MNAEKEAKVIGFLVAKGLLYAPRRKRFPQVKLRIEDVLQVAENVEPRVYEVLPAAILHFPKSFLGLERLPRELSELVDAIRKGEERDTMYRGLRYRDMKRWADLPLLDRRTKPVSEKRTMKALRFKPTTIKALQELAEAKGTTATEVIETLVESAAKKAKLL